MITNLIASVVVSLVTNVTERFPQHQEPVPPNLDGGGGVFAIPAVYTYRMVDDANPTRKWVKTTVTKATKFKFLWNWKLIEVSDAEVVSEVEVEFALQPQAWAPVGTNALNAAIQSLNETWAKGTNYFFTNIAYLTNRGVVWITTTNSFGDSLK